MRSAKRRRLVEKPVSPEMVTLLPPAVSKRNANAGAMGGCTTRVAVTVTRSSSKMTKGSISGEKLSFGW